jgi:hypothetical protein
VANPFQGLFPDNPGASGSTIARRRLLLAYPHFDTLSIETYRGTNRYHGVLARFDKRFTDGLMIMSTYTWSQFREKVAPLTPWEDLEDRVSPGDRPHRVTPPRPSPSCRSARGNVYYDAGCGDPSNLTSHWGTEGGQKLGIDVPFFDTSCFYTRDGQPFVNIRRFPITLPNLRFQNHHLLDLGLTKSFQLGGRVRLQVRVEALNATNYTLFNAGNVIRAPTNAAFGKITNIDSSTVMKPRDYQLGLRLTF